MLSGKYLLEWFGPEFLIGYVPLMILSIGLSANFISMGSYYYIAMSKHSMYNLYIDISSLILNIFLCYILIPKYSILGAAIATMLSSIVLALARLLFCRKVLASL